MRTSVTEFLDAAGVSYEIKPHSQPVFTCEDAARERGVRLSQIVKCMMGADPDGGIHVMLIPGDKTLKIRRVRPVAGGVRIDLLSPQEIEERLGLTVGAISPLQLVGKVVRFYLDHSVLREEFVDISSGEPDAGVELRSEDLRELLNAVRCDIISTSGR